MDQDGSVTHGAPGDTKTAASTESRRRMLRRSLGAAAPVVLTLASAPVSAGQCVSASAFVSANAFASKTPAMRGSRSCQGLSPADWAARDANHWPGKLRGNMTFIGKLKQPPLSAYFDKNATLLEVLKVPATVEAHVVAALLNTYNGGMEPPFETPQSVLEIWANIHAHGGYYVVDNGLKQQAMTVLGTLEWLSMSWRH